MRLKRGSTRPRSRQMADAARAPRTDALGADSQAQPVGDVELLRAQIAVRLGEWSAAQGSTSICRTDQVTADAARLKSLEGAVHALKDAERWHAGHDGALLDAVDSVVAQWQERARTTQGEAWSAYLTGGIESLQRFRASL